MGEILALLGCNGVGKTTRLRAMTGTVRVSAGRVVLDSRDLIGAKLYEINRAGISMAPEGRRLFTNLKVYENLRLAHRPGGTSVDEANKLFPKLHWLHKTKAKGLPDGERQMVAILESLVAPSRVSLLDERFEGLAPAIVNDIMETILLLRSRASPVIVEHHAEAVLPIGDRVYLLVNGRFAHQGPAAVLAGDPALQARLLGVVQAGPADEAIPMAVPG